MKIVLIAVFFDFASVPMSLLSRCLGKILCRLVNISVDSGLNGRIWIITPFGPAPVVSLDI